MDFLQDKIVVYDGNCRICTAFAKTVKKAAMVKEDGIANLYDLPESNLEKVDLKRFKNEMALIDLKGGTTLYGLDVVARIFGQKFPILWRLYSISFLQPFYWFFYRIIAYNRFLIAPPPWNSDFTCDCEPDYIPKFRFLFLGLLSLLLYLLFLPISFQISKLHQASETAMPWLLAAAWLASPVLFSLIVRLKKSDPETKFLGHVLVCQSVAAFIWLLLLPLSFLANPFGEIALYVSGGIGLSFWYSMMKMRLAHLSLSAYWRILCVFLYAITFSLVLWFLN